MNDDALKREIEEALDVEPSPQFATRVRQHIAEQAVRRPVRLSWKVWAPGLAMAGLLLALLVYSPEPATTPLKPESVAVARVETKEIAPAPRAKPSAPPARPRVIAEAPAREASTEPEVLIDPREAAAFRSFLDGIEKRKIDPSMLEALFAAAERAQSAVIEPMPVAGLTPIEIPPAIAPAPEKEGGSL